MRVFIISANWGSGSVGGIVRDLYHTLTEHGHTCCFAYGRGDVPEEVNSIRIGTKWTPYVHAACARIFDNAGFLSTAATRKLVREIREFAPDVISIQNPLGYTLDVQVLFDFIRESGIPTFWTMHDCWAVTGHCITGLCDHWQSGCGNCPRKHAFPQSLVLDRSAANLKKKKKIFSDIPNLRLITPSHWLAQLLQQTYMKHYPVQVIHNGIDQTIFCPTDSDLRVRYQLEGKKLLLAVAGVWEESKGASYFYELTRRLGEEYAFVMIGKNNDHQLQENPRILHIPRTNDQKELAAWYTAADMLINPTMGDNFPTVNLEALACGTPVVTFDTGGSKESVGDCGEIALPGDIESLMEAIASCDARRITRQQCLNRAKNFDKKKCFETYTQLFQQA